MILTGKHLSRRTLLRGLGTSLALPMLDSMVPAFGSKALGAAAATDGAKQAPLRLAFTYIPNGVNYSAWKPVGEGAGYAFSPTLKPLEKYREDLMVLTGLDLHNGNALGDGGGDHARAGASYLTGVHCKKTTGADIKGGVSADQIAAQQMKTRLTSLELGCEDSRTVGNCDSGFSCAYTNSISWRNPTMPMPPETNPRVVFERLFGSDNLKVDEATKARRNLLRTSILDVVGERSKQLMGEVGPSDRRKLDEYMTGIREVERRIQMAESTPNQFKPGIEAPSGVPVEFAEYAKLMFDLQILAFQADLTRVSTFMIGREGSVRTYSEIGVADPHHPITHHQNKADFLAKVAKINLFHVELFSYYVEKMKATQDGDGSLLDHSMVIYGGGLNDGNRHEHENLPTVLVGRGNGKLKPGRHVVYPVGTPMTNLYMSLLDHMDVRPETIGDSTGKLQHLSSL